MSVAAGKSGKRVAGSESQRYAESRIECIQLADALDNEYFRSAALQPIIELCLKGRDVDDARALFKHVKIAFIRNRMIDDHPELRDDPVATLGRGKVCG